MNPDFANAMRRAMRSTNASDPSEATRIIQDALAGRATPERAAPPSFRISPDAETVEPVTQREPRRDLAGVIARLREGRAALNFDAPHLVSDHGPDIPDGARFLSATHSGPAGARDYRLYIPAALPPEGPRGLVVMLHGCKQNPEDFALGTAMNVRAEEHGLLVAWPRQTGAHNATNCWNWFRAGDQTAGAGEPAILAALAREIAAEHGVPLDSIFIAGLSAGGAMAAIAGATHPDTFSAIGVHSGLPAGAAKDVIGAFAAMRGDVSGTGAPLPRSIVFHGETDNVVHPSNGARVFQSAGGGRDPRVETGPGWTRTRAGGSEHWSVHGLGHAWSGGDPRGSYAAPSGPDASAEMARFFLETPRE